MSVTTTAAPGAFTSDAAPRDVLDADAAAVDVRAIRALVRCIARFGLAKTTLDDVAREAGCSRATLYRYFDGKSELLRRMIASEEARVVATVVGAASAETTFADAVVAVVTTAARELAANDALQFLVTHEPDAILGHLAFAEGDAVLVHAGAAIAPAFTRFLDAAGATRAGEWLARVLRSYALLRTPRLDLSDPVIARHFLEQFVIPGLERTPRKPASKSPASKSPASKSPASKVGLESR